MDLFKVVGLILLDLCKNMNKILWINLNPIEKFKRFKNTLWLQFIAIVILFLKLNFLIAGLITSILVIASFSEYKRLKAKSEIFRKCSSN